MNLKKVNLFYQNLVVFMRHEVVTGDTEFDMAPEGIHALVLVFVGALGLFMFRGELG